MTIYSTLYGVTSTILSNLLVPLPIPHGAPLAGQTIVVTGGNQGLGLEASKHLARLGAAHIILGVRRVPAGEAAKSQILAHAPSPAALAVDVWNLDLASYASVRAFAARAARETPAGVDALLLNAGIATAVWSLAEDNEVTLTTNVVASFLLALLLLPTLRKATASPVPRITLVGSAVHFWAPFAELESPRGAFAAMNDEATADMRNRYFVSKLVATMAARALAAELSVSTASKEGGKSKRLVVLNNVNPSYCRSNLARDPGSDSFGARMAARLLARSTEAGSRTLVAGVLAGRESHGEYMNNCHVAKCAPTVRSAHGKQIQEKVWRELVERLEGIEPGVMRNI